MRTFLVITLLFLALLGGGVYLMAFYQPAPDTSVAPVDATTMTAANTEPVATTATTPPPAIVSTCVKGGVCTQTEVAKHNTRTDCYVSMSNLGKVYDVTEYMRNSSIHPGGDISDYCGVDIFVSFTGQNGDHRHSGGAMQDLSSFEFATLR